LRAAAINLFLSLATVTASIWPAQASAATDPPAPSAWSLRQEYLGIEIAPVSFNLGSAPDGRAPPRLQVGPGGRLRLLRHRWTEAYWTPVSAGLLVTSGNETIFTHVESEGGWVVPATSRALELGLAAGFGILSIAYASGCDGSCLLGGAGPMLSPLVRYLARQGPRFNWGFVVRAVIPLRVPDGDWWGYYNGRAVLFLGALDIAVGY
jgi:hypothetical protein